MLAAYREELGKRCHVRSVKQHLSALRKVFDQLVMDQVIPLNPTASVKGPKFSARDGTTPILTDQETRKLFDRLDTSHVVGLRDRAILAALVYAVGRVSAVTSMRVRDFFPSGRRWKVRLHATVFGFRTPRLFARRFTIVSVQSPYRRRWEPEPVKPDFLTWACC